MQCVHASASLRIAKKKHQAAARLLPGASFVLGSVNPSILFSSLR